jgi:hypothetical protein
MSCCHILSAGIEINRSPFKADQIVQFDNRARRELRPLLEATEKHRRDEIRSFRSNGGHVRVVEMRHTAHYCFVQRPAAVTRLIVSFLMSAIP